MPPESGDGVQVTGKSRRKWIAAALHANILCKRPARLLHGTLFMGLIRNGNVSRFIPGREFAFEIRRRRSSVKSFLLFDRGYHVHSTRNKRNETYSSYRRVSIVVCTSAYEIFSRG